MTAIEIRGLVKDYGSVQALRGVDLAVEEGEIFGLLGRNGAGKTTLVKILLGLAHRTGGEALLLGEPAGKTASRRHVGYLPEGHLFPEYHTAASALDFYGALADMPRPDRRSRIPAVLEQVGLKDWTKAKIGTFSKGMKQRLGIANAILTRPKIAFLDEPTDGVDPVGRRDIRDLLLHVRKEGTTVFLNSHLLGEVEMVCDRVAILELGRVLRLDRVENLTRVSNQYVLRVQGPAGPVLPDLRRLCVRADLADDVLDVEVEREDAVDAIVDLLRSRGLSIRELAGKKRTLEEVFLSMVGDQHAAGGQRA